MTGFASIALPDTTNAIVIDGNATLGRPFFGYRVLGLGHFYSVSSGTTLLASALGPRAAQPPMPGACTLSMVKRGRPVSFRLGPRITSLLGRRSGARIGIVLTNLRTMLNGFPGVGIGNLQDTIDIPGGNGGAYLTFGTPSTGPFASMRIAYHAGVNSVGGILVGGGLSGGT